MQKKIDSFKAFLKMAEDLDPSEPVIALSCRLYFIEKFLTIKRESGSPLTAEEQGEFNKIYTQIEESKKSLGMTKEEMKEAVEEFCGRAFVGIDKEDRTAPKITKDHAKRFVTTSHFIELLSLNGGMTPKWEELSRF